MRKWALSGSLLLLLALVITWRVFDNGGSASSQSQALPPIDSKTLQQPSNLEANDSKERLTPPKSGQVANVAPTEAAEKVLELGGIMTQAASGASRFEVTLGVYDGSAERVRGKLIYVVSGDNKTTCLDFGPDDGAPKQNPGQCNWYAKVDANTGEVYEFIWTPDPVLQ
jgi:hypothetical protein